MVEPNVPLNAVRNALAACAGDTPLRDGAAALLGALGYRSELTEDLGGVAAFVDWLDGARDEPLTEKQRQFLEPWRAADIVFQFTDDEIKPLHQAELFVGTFDRGRANSFLFVAADLEPRPGNRPYSRTDLAGRGRTTFLRSWQNV